VGGGHTLSRDSQQLGVSTLELDVQISPVASDDTDPPDVFASKFVSAIQEAGMSGRTTIQSFYWRTLRESRRLDPRIHTVARLISHNPAPRKAVSWCLIS
jgi:glycerophosphoryl diester phosphodiesterase